MPVYKVTTFKRTPIYPDRGSEFSNVYHITAADFAAAQVAAVGLATAEQDLYSDQVEIWKVITDTGTGISNLELANLFGTRTDLVDILPPFNVARIDFALIGSAYTLKKYFRMTLAESDINGSTFNPDVLTLLADVGSALLAVGGLCNEAGDLADTGGSHVNPQIQMRQVRWSRRARPGFHRAYVPNA